MTRTTGSDTPPPPAAILRFPRRRGRPKTRRMEHDSGTPELIMKRLKGETAEALDLCLQRGIVTDRQHWCGIHLRWLYTLRYGAPNVRAVDPSHWGGREGKLDDPDWRAAREAEYHEAIAALNKHGHALLLLNLCVYNQRPPFLSLSNAVTKKRADETERAIALIRNGLDTLARHWKRPRSNPANPRITDK